MKIAIIAVLALGAYGLYTYAQPGYTTYQYKAPKGNVNVTALFSRQERWGY